MKNRKLGYVGLLLATIVYGGTQAQALKVQPAGDETYKIDIATPPSKSKLTWSVMPDSWAGAKTIAMRSQGETVAMPSAHPIVRLSAKGEKDFYASPRLLVLRGAVNFRDLGGYMTKDQREVRWGKIFRSADISKITDEDLAKLAALHIKTVCDLRGPAEVNAAPDRLPPGAVSLNLPAGSENTGAPGSFLKYMKNANSADSIMKSVYVKNDFYKAKYKPMFDQLLDLEEDKAILFHCTAGKDRTGIGAALILYALGVDEPTILKDYELTNEYRKGSNETMINMIAAQGISVDVARRMMAADPAWLKSCFESLARNFGSVDGFLENEIGLTSDKRERLRMKFLY